LGADIFPDAAFPSLAESRAIAIDNAVKTGDDKIVKAVTDITEKLADYEAKAVEAGFIERGIAGYFPIFNEGQFRLELAKGAGIANIPGFEFRGFFDTRRQAERAGEKLVREGGAKNFNVVPNTMAWDAMAIDDVARFAELRGTVGSTAGPFRHRRHGIQDFAVEPEEALNIYAATVERALAFKELRRITDGVLQEIPASQGNLRVWITQLRDDLLGVPRPQEKVFQQTMQWLSDTAFNGHLPVPPRALKKYSSTIRSWESFSRLGGFSSPIVNLTQTPINTTTVLGAKYTAKGMELIWNRKKWRSSISEMLEMGVQGIEHFAGLTREGQPLVTEGLKGIISDAKQKKFASTIHSIALYGFNGAEKVNRVVAAWGAYNMKLAELGSRSTAAKQAAAKFATEVVERTQFNYSMANMPQVLRGPLGGVIGQFKSFIIQELQFISSLNKREATRFGAAVWAMGGVGLLINIPGPDLIDEASGLFFDKKVSEALKLGEFQESAFGRTVALGLPGLVNIDVSDYVGLGSLRDITRGLFGPAVSDVTAFSNYVKDASIDVAQGRPVSDDVTRAFVQKVLPSAIRRGMRAQDIMETGEVRNAYTRKLIYKPEARLQTAISQGVGFPTVRLSQERAADDIASRVIQRWKDNRAESAKAVALHLIRGEDEEARAVQNEANASGLQLDFRTVRYYVKELQRPAGERRRRRTPKVLRSTLEEVYDLTGSVTGVP
jgi:hypothetical protein